MPPLAIARIVLGHALPQMRPLLLPKGRGFDTPSRDRVGEVDAVPLRVLLRRVFGRIRDDSPNRVEDRSLARIGVEIGTDLDRVDPALQVGADDGDRESVLQ